MVYHKQIFNYPLPEAFYQRAPSQEAWDFSHETGTASIPRSTHCPTECVSPLDLSRSHSHSSNGFGEAFPNRHRSDTDTSYTTSFSYSPMAGSPESDDGVYSPDFGANYTLQSSSSNKRNAHRSSQFSYFGSMLPSVEMSSRDMDYISSQQSRPTKRTHSSSSARDEATYTRHNLDSIIPSAVNVEIHRTTDRFYCDHPGCVGENQIPPSFARKADLKRHRESKHEVQHITCTMNRCDRIFTRRDHMREHLRGYHNQTIPKKAARR